MIHNNQLEDAICGGIALITKDAPPILAEAIRYAVFPGGGRVRPLITLAVAEAIAGESNPLSRASAVAVEMMHCASLVHDDLPAFDNADSRRGKPALFRVYGQDTAILVGDALIVGAFEVLGTASASSLRGARLMTTLARAAGAAKGIIAGQAWETEPKAELTTIHALKTGALFEAAAVLGAQSVGQKEHSWREFGARVGAAYQVADDLLDTLGHAATAGKPVGQDLKNNRRNAALEHGVSAAVSKLQSLLEEAEELVPESAKGSRLMALVSRAAQRLVPEDARLRYPQLFSEETSGFPRAAASL
ncbi:MAG: polyprenyl synthetase family protein [Myxococcota bacterium]|jgi:geranylgeranyl diphosphate synthase type II|nr:polyprenyl synthetase family protein [Myxococcota bacterium]